MVSIIMIIIAYLLGSVSTGIIVCKLMNLPDPRKEGSGNIGAANVMRVGNRYAGILTLVGDALKGFIAVLLARILGVDGFMLGLVALAAVLGHIYPVFYRFVGGKGVATGFGGLLVLSFGTGLVAIVVWAVIIALTRYVSLASMCAAVIAALLLLFVEPAYFIPVAIIICLIAWRHMDNIQRLKEGTEAKFEWK